MWRSGATFRVAPLSITPWLAIGALLASLATASAEQAPSATLRISSATAGSSLGGRLVEGVMTFRGNDYILILRGVERAASARGSIYGMARARDVEGIFKPSDAGLRNAAGVTIRFDPPLAIAEKGLEIEVANRRTPKVSSGHRGSGVE